MHPLNYGTARPHDRKSRLLRGMGEIGISIISFVIHRRATVARFECRHERPSHPPRPSFR